MTYSPAQLERVVVALIAVVGVVIAMILHGRRDKA
jgi:hypothetical protein